MDEFCFVLIYLYIYSMRISDGNCRWIKQIVFTSRCPLFRPHLLNSITLYYVIIYLFRQICFRRYFFFVYENRRCVTKMKTILSAISTRTHTKSEKYIVAKSRAADWQYYGDKHDGQRLCEASGWASVQFEPTFTNDGIWTTDWHSVYASLTEIHFP